jgi:DeoR/GlpR family transcriptional regulator of sugar metabolism
MESKPPAVLRHRKILDKLDDAGFGSTIQIADWLSVSEMTIRRDFDVLAEEKQLTRTHGGAISINHRIDTVIDLIEPEILERETTKRDAKSAIAKCAFKLISDGQSLALDIGSTASALSNLLHHSKIRLFTSSLKIASSLKETRAQVYLPGGRLTGNEPSVTGPIAKAFFEKYYFDFAFICASGMTEEGLFDYSLEDTEIKRILIQRSRKVVALLDSSKFSRISVAHVSGFDEINTLITDAPVPAKLEKSLKSANVRIEVASSSVQEGKTNDI